MVGYRNVNFKIYMRRVVYKKAFSSSEDRWGKYCKMHKVVKEWL